MSDELRKIDPEELNSASGGKDHRESVLDCPPGTIEIKNEQLKNTHEHRKKCPFCDNKKGLEDHKYFMVDTKTLIDGQYCPKCEKRWITHG